MSSVAQATRAQLGSRKKNGTFEAVRTVEVLQDNMIDLDGVRDRSMAAALKLHRAFTKGGDMVAAVKEVLAYAAHMDRVIGTIVDDANARLGRTA